MSKPDKQLTAKGKEILSAFVKAASKLKRFPTRADMMSLGYSRDAIRENFTSLEKLKEVAVAQRPVLFDEIERGQITSDDRAAELKKAVKKYKRYVVTSVVDGAPVHKGMLASLKGYCEHENAILLLLPSGNTWDDIDPALSSEHWVFESLSLNSNIMISSIRVPSKTVNPLTGLGRLGQRNGSTIMASPKQFFEPVAVGDSKFPHVMMSTGAVTKPFYSSLNGQMRKTDTVASHDHILGAIVVEIEDDKFYHFRQLQAEPDTGAVVDLGYRYCGDKKKKYAPSHFVIGDYHVTETDPFAAKAWDEIQKFTGVRKRVHHDAFSGVSINRHEQDNYVLRAKLSLECKLDLETELREFAKMLDVETAKCDEVVIVDSNHHDFLTKHYLQHGIYLNEPNNFKIAHKLVAAVMEGKDPLRYAVEEVIGLKYPKKIRWLKRDESYCAAGIEMGAHGDKGANGSKGSPNTLERAYGNCVVGHSHSPRIVRGFWQVGTSTLLRLPYTVGASSWMQTSCLVYPNGSRQLVNSICGKWRVKK